MCLLFKTSLLFAKYSGNLYHYFYKQITKQSKITILVVYANWKKVKVLQLLTERGASLDKPAEMSPFSFPCMDPVVATP
jgi:hypothetical protein